MHRLHPAVSVMQDADRRIKGWLIEFGQTPSARSRIKVEGYELDEDGVAAKFFDRDRGI
jgi:phage terminase small subunit